MHGGSWQSENMYPSLFYSTGSLTKELPIEKVILEKRGEAFVTELLTSFMEDNREWNMNQLADYSSEFSDDDLGAISGTTPTHSSSLLASSWSCNDRTTSKN